METYLFKKGPYRRNMASPNDIAENRFVRTTFH